MTFGERLKQLREEKSYSQKEFAEKLNISATGVSHFEKGSNYPKLTVLIQMMQILKCDANCLFQDYINQDYINIEETKWSLEHKHLDEKFQKISASEQILIANLIEAAYVRRKSYVEEEKLISKPLYAPVVYEGAYFYLGEAKAFWMRETEKNQKADFCLKLARKADMIEGKTGTVLLLKKESLHHNDLGVFKIGKRAFIAKFFVSEGKIKLKLIDLPDTIITVTKEVPIITMGKIIGRLEGQYHI